MAGLRQVEATDADSGEVAASLRLERFGTAGALQLRNRRGFRFRRLRWFPAAWGIVDAYSSPVITFHPFLFVPWARGGICRMQPAGNSLPDAGLLDVLGVFTLLHRVQPRPA